MIAIRPIQIVVITNPRCDQCGALEFSDDVRCHRCGGEKLDAIGDIEPSAPTPLQRIEQQIAERSAWQRLPGGYVCKTCGMTVQAAIWPINCQCSGLPR